MFYCVIEVKETNRGPEGKKSLCNKVYYSIKLKGLFVVVI